MTASPHHGLVVSTSADGSAVLTSGVRALRKRRVRGHFSHKVFRLDFKRETGELRMWDNLETEVSRLHEPHDIEDELVEPSCIDLCALFSTASGCSRPREPSSLGEKRCRG